MLETTSRSPDPIEGWLPEIFDDRLKSGPGGYVFDGRSVPARNGILRFTPDESYSSGNFERLRERHGRLQLDSASGLDTSYNTILERTNWPPEFFKDKLVLECGCGAGPDTEALLRLGARVVSVDLAGLDVAQGNIGAGARNLFVQASIMDLPFRKEAFDIVYCHRVLQHTPDPKAALRHMLQFVKPGGAVFIHSYSTSIAQMLHWKYALRPITKRMQSERLYALVNGYVPALFHLTNAIRRIPPRRLGKLLFRAALQILPVRNPSGNPAFARASQDYLLEYAIHNTFDSLSPRYDQPVAPKDIRAIASEILRRPFEIVAKQSITLLRTIPEKERSV